MKKNSVKFLAVFLMLFTSCLMTSCNDSQNDSITQAQTIEDEFDGIEVTPGYQFIKSFDVVTDKNDTIVVKLVKSIERNTYSLLTETGTGKLVASALCKFIDGTEVLIEDVQDFALDTEIASIEINLLDVKPVEDISLPAKKYIGYYLGTNYTFDFTANTYPLDAQTYVEYYSSNTSVARINRHGKLKIVGAGTTTISAISLNGGCVAHCLFKIKNGTDKLKDSMGFAEFSNVALDGNRYDEVSMQTTIFEHMAISSKTGTVLVGGKASVSGYSGPFSGIVNYGIPTDGKGFNSKIQIDPENKYRSDYVVDVAYVPNNDSFLVLGKIASDSYNVSSATTFIVCLKETYDSDIGFVLESTYTKEFNMDIQKIAICDNSIYVVNYEGTVQKLNSATFEVENQFETNIKEISILKANNSSNSLLLVGKNENGANCIAVIDLGNFSITKGYSSVFTDGTITDAEFVSEDASKIVVISNGTINSNNVGLVEAFRLTNNKASFESYKHQIIESSEYTITKLNKILYNNGLIVILGYAVGEQAVKSSCCGEDMVRYGYGTVLKMSQHLEFVGNSYKYFNGGDGGKDQQFLNGLVLPNGSLIAIGDSNYKYEDVRNGYIQYNIQIID